MHMSSPLDCDPIDPEVRGFFHAIKENPHDDTLRLIFADWLQEHGNPADAARGEFLRLNVLRHRLSPDDPTYDLLKRREAEIFTEHRWAWLGPLVDAAKSWTLERGMIQITANDANLTTPEVTAWARTSSALWIDALALSSLSCLHIQELAESPLLAQLNCLDLSDNHRHSVLNLLVCGFRWQRVPFLTRLNLENCRLTRLEIDHLSRSRGLRRLNLLDLEHNRLDDIAARSLAESRVLNNVAELRLGRNRFTAEGMAILIQAFGHRAHF